MKVKRRKSTIRVYVGEVYECVRVYEEERNKEYCDVLVK